jgi:hypothetical protein
VERAYYIFFSFKILPVLTISVANASFDEGVDDCSEMSQI